MIGFHGADPDGLDGLAAAVASRAASVTRAANETHSILDRFGRPWTGDRVGGALVRTARTLGVIAVDLGRRATLVRDAERLVPGAGLPTLVTSEAAMRAEFSLVAPVAPPDWHRAYRDWRDGPAPTSLVGRAPLEVSAVFAEISGRARHRLVLNAPELVGSLDGAPPDLRYAANRILIHREVSRLHGVAAALTFELDDLDADGGFRSVIEREVFLEELAGIEATIARYRRWTAEDRQILLFDPAGDGRVAEVFGELTAAAHVAVVVPGITNDIGNFGPGDGGGFRANAFDLFTAASLLDASVATIAWLGYDTPDGADAVLRSAANQGHDDLIRFVDGIVADGDRHVTVIGHSYGSLVIGMAAGRGIAADEVVFVGSPGTSLDHTGDANLPAGGDVWSGLAAWDPIGAGVSLVPSDAWEGSLSLPGRYLWDLITSGDLAAEDLWHGTNPAHESFGAIEFTTDGATGHSQYFDPGTESLANLARIVAGLAPQVSVLSSEPMELAPGPFGEPSGDPMSDVV